MHDYCVRILSKSKQFNHIITFLQSTGKKKGDKKKGLSSNFAF